MTYLLLVVGFGLLLLGGEGLIRGAVRIADRLGVPPIIVGLTIVALGTSAPELTVSIDAALKGVPDLVTGSIVGSNISNVLLVLGMVALVSPVVNETSMARRDGPMLMLATGLMVLLAVAGTIRPWHGVVLVALFAVYTLFSYWREDKRRKRARKRAQEEGADLEQARPGLAFSLVLFVAGLASVILGADILVDAAVELARRFGVSEAVIGLSLIAIGTSLPELAVSVIAAVRGHPGVALGNVVGSNIANVLVILGITATITPIPVSQQIASFDVWVMLVATVAMVPALLAGGVIARWQGALFVCSYALYIFAIYANWPAWFGSVIWF